MMIKKLQKIETQEYRNITSKDLIDMERKKYTAIFKYLLSMKEKIR
jgi:hypothetical protein